MPTLLRSDAPVPVLAALRVLIPAGLADPAAIARHLRAAVHVELEAVIEDLHAWVRPPRDVDTVLGQCKLCGIRVAATLTPWIHEAIVCTQCVMLTPEWFGPADAAALAGWEDDDGLAGWEDDAQDDEDDEDDGPTGHLNRRGL